MRILFFGNNRLAGDAAAWLAGRPERIVGAVLHPDARRKHGDDIRRALQLPDEAIIDASTLEEPATMAAVRALRPDIGVSVLFGYILRAPLLALLPRGCVNLHSGYLPYNRGAYPNVWSLVEGTPSGVTLHYIDEGIDTGDIIAQREVPAEPWDTAETLYARLEAEGLALFRESWPAIVLGAAPRTPQPLAGTSHRLRDVQRIDEIDLDRQYTGRELLDVLRARSFPPYPGAYFRANGQRIHLELRLTPRREPQA